MPAKELWGDCHRIRGWKRVDEICFGEQMGHQSAQHPALDQRELEGLVHLVSDARHGPRVDAAAVRVQHLPPLWEAAQRDLTQRVKA